MCVNIIEGPIFKRIVGKGCSEKSYGSGWIYEKYGRFCCWKNAVIDTFDRSVYKGGGYYKKSGVKPMKLQHLTFEVCPRCQSTFIERTENENPTWRCSDCLYVFELPLIAKFPEPEE